MPHDEVMTADDKKWQAESDARTLAEAVTIKDDPKRMEAAVTAAKDLFEDKMEEALGMKSIATLKFKDME